MTDRNSITPTTFKDAINSIKTVADVSNILENLNKNGVQNMYCIGVALNRAKELDPKLNIVAYGEKFGYKSAFTYRIAKVAKEFVLEDVMKWGIEKLAIAKTPDGLKLLESKGVKPTDTVDTVKKNASNEKNVTEKPPRQKSRKTINKEEIKKIEKAIKTMSEVCEFSTSGILKDCVETLKQMKEDRERVIAKMEKEEMEKEEMKKKAKKI